jgi:7-cyano-7-deazaguanine synthase in queuosine biosynthesis
MAKVKTINLETSTGIPCGTIRTWTLEKTGEVESTIKINFGKRDKTEHEALNEVADELEKQAFLLRNLLNARKAGVKR